MDRSVAYDVFVSYRRADATPVLGLVALLRERHALRVWLDQTEIETFESSTQAIADGIAQSRALLAWYSLIYPESRPCQVEFAAGFLAAARQGDPRRRVLIVNPAPGNAHIHPVELRDQNYLNVGAAQEADLERSAAAIADHLSRLDGCLLGEPAPLERPRWYRKSAVSSARFSGRLGDLFALHSMLRGPSLPIVARERVPIVQLRGLGGLGKTLLAEEYALRFGISYPAGVFWLRAAATDEAGRTLDRVQRDAGRAQQLRAIASELGATDDEMPNAEAARGALVRRIDTLMPPDAFLWIVDDLPVGLGRDEVDAWVAPHPRGATLITTRSREHDAFGSVLDLQALRDDEAFGLLSLHRPATTPAEQQAAREVASQLGALPLALDIAGAAIRLDPGTGPYARYAQRLSRPGKDALELSARLAGELPTGHTASVAVTLLESIRQLQGAAPDFLRLAAQLAPAPIPFPLVAAVFGAAFELAGDDAGDAVVEAFRACQLRSLADARDDRQGTAYQVHALVARTVALYDEASERAAALRSLAVAVLLDVLPGVVDVRAHPALESYVVHARQLVGGTPADAQVALLVGWVARFEYERGSYAAAEALSRRQLADFTRLHGADSELALFAMGDLARSLSALDRNDEALVLLRAVLKGRRKRLGHKHIDTLTAMNNLAVTLSAMERHTEALALQKRVLATRRRELGPTHEHTAFAMNNYGSGLASLGREAEARPYLEEAYRLRRALHGPDHVDTIHTAAALGTVLFALGERQRAIELLQEVVELSDKLLGSDHRRTLNAQAALGRILIAGGQLQKARQVLEPAFACARDRLGSDNRLTLLLANNLGKALVELGSLEEARPLLEQAVDGQARRAGVRDRLLVRYALNLYELLLRLPDETAARDVFDRHLAWLLEADASGLVGSELEDRERLLRNPLRRP